MFSPEHHLTRPELLERCLDRLPQLWEAHSISFAYLAGSWAKNQQGKLSDIDIFISWPKFTQESSSSQFNLLRTLMAQVDTRTQLEPIEISILEYVPLHVQFQAIVDGVLIYERSREERLVFIEHLLTFYYDHKIWFESYLDQAVGQQGET